MTAMVTDPKLTVPDDTDLDPPCEAHKVNDGPGDSGEPCPAPAAFILFRVACCPSTRNKLMLFCPGHTDKMVHLDAVMHCSECGHAFRPGSLLIERVEAL